MILIGNEWVSWSEHVRSPSPKSCWDWIPRAVKAGWLVRRKFDYRSIWMNKQQGVVKGDVLLVVTFLGMQKSRVSVSLAIPKWPSGVSCTSKKSLRSFTSPSRVRSRDIMFFSIWSPLFVTMYILSYFLHEEHCTQDADSLYMYVLLKHLFPLYLTPRRTGICYSIYCAQETLSESYRYLTYLPYCTPAPYSTRGTVHTCVD